MDMNIYVTGQSLLYMYIYIYRQITNIKRTES